MRSAAEILRSFLNGVRYLTGATSAAIYVPSASAEDRESLLISEGSEGPPRELANPHRARAQTDALLEAPGMESAFAIPAAEEDCWLLPLSPATEGPNSLPFSGSGPERRRPVTGGRTTRPRGWLGLRYVRSETDEAKLPPTDPLQSSPFWHWVVDFGACLAEQAVQINRALRDPVTGMPARLGFQALLHDHSERARQLATPLSLLLINPHNFGQVNERHGREAGDRVIQELGNLITATLRESDPISRYGGAIFAALLPDTPEADAQSVAEKLVESVRASTFFDDQVRLELCCGGATRDPHQSGRLEPLNLLRRADQALNRSRRAGEGSIEMWREGELQIPTQISSVFTGNLARDYRNMALLRDIVDLVADSDDLDTLSVEVVERLYSACKAERVGIFRRDDAGDLHLVRGIERPANPSAARGDSFELTPEAGALVSNAIEAKRIESGVVETSGAERRLAYVVPLVNTGRATGALYISGSVESIDIDPADLVFFKALGSQLSIALDRARLSILASRREGQEQSRLEADLQALRSAVRESHLEYKSDEMDRLMSAVKRVGPTEATILVAGESGTGKELVARAIHACSGRSAAVFDVIDCSSIAPTLVDSELFGHIGDAYTGAQRLRQGRFAEADGGTVLLDEIGELSLEVQRRLLRFVEDKQIAVAGEARPHQIDVRILAATNRDLETEVAEGRFREDLFHRLGVVRLVVPPLRSRPEDIEHLAEYFLAQFSKQYGKVGARLTDSAREALQRYPWPGNVRELQNRVLQAVILMTDREIDAASLGLPAPVAKRGTPRSRDPKSRESAVSVSRSLELLREALGEMVHSATENANAKFPLGKWLSDDLILEAEQSAGNVSRRAAQRLGLAETTFRRRQQQAEERLRAGLAPRADGWDDVKQALTSLLHASDRDGQPLLQLALSTLLKEILQQIPSDETLGSALMGVTLPTFRRRIEAHDPPDNAGSPQN